MNAKNGLKNIITNLLYQVIVLVLGIVIPRLVLVNLGSEANGLLNSVNQMLAYVALLEAGVGAASLQALYNPVAHGDKASISSIMAATNYFYKRTGRLYFFIVVFLAFVFPYTIQTELPKSDVVLAVLLSGLPGVVNYYFQGKFRILMQAEGKSYILTSLTAIIHVLTNVSKIILLISGFDVVALQAMYLFFNIAQMSVIMIYMKRHYKWLDLSVKPNFDAISQSKNAMVHQISGFVFNNTDALILTYFCGLSTVSVYSMYTMLFGIIATIISNFNGANFIIAQAFHTDKEKYIKLHDVYEVFNMTLTFSLFCITNIFILPFMELYTQDIHDAEYVDKILPYLFVATNLLSCGQGSSSQAINHAGHFKQTQWHAVVEMLVNLVFSILCVWNFGIYGVLFGTVAAQLFRVNAMILYANIKILKQSPWITYRRWLLNLALFIVVTIAAKYLFSFIVLDSYFKIIFWAIICCIVIIPMFFVTVSLFDRDVYRFAKSLIAPYIQAAVHKLRHSSPSA